MYGAISFLTIFPLKYKGMNFLYVFIYFRLQGKILPTQ